MHLMLLSGIFGLQYAAALRLYAFCGSDGLLL